MRITVVETTNPLPALRYGGTERVLYWLMKELVKKGHTVAFIGHPASLIDDIGASFIPCAKDDDWRLLVPKGTDIVHTSNASALDIDFPYVNTVHTNDFDKPYPVNSIFVSRNHAFRHNSAHYVYNGIDVSEYPMMRDRENKNRNYLFLANARWDVKNLRDCIEASFRLGKRLYVCGGNYRSGLKFFKRDGLGMVKAILPNIRYCGMIGQDRKLPLMSRIDAFLWPVRWHEPFGIAMIEAMSQGIPVFASRYGSMPELVPENCGVLTDSFQSFVESLAANDSRWDSAAIRDHAIRNFSSEVMADCYVRYYERVLSGESLHADAPILRDDVRLLPF